jgi:methyl-accepting chemotaxis protein
MDTVFSFSHFVLTRMNNPTKFTLLGVLFGIPTFMRAFLELESTASQIVLVASLTITAYFAIGFYFHSQRGWQRLMPSLDRLCKGDFTATFETDRNYRKGPFVQLQALALTANSNFSTVVQRGRLGSARIGELSKALATGNVDLSQRTEQQAALLEETAAAMEELSATVKHNADRCHDSHTRAQKASAVAESGSYAVRQAMEAMTYIDLHSKRVSDIMDAVADIAFQTNILALNAAVEAARAGDHGQGFSVVASEVQSLSQRSADAVKQIRALIDESRARVEDGKRHVASTSDLIANVLNNIREVSNLIAEIATASKEQSTGVEQINRALVQLDRMTQANATLVDQTRDTVKAFEREAPGLAMAVTRFKIRDDESYGNPLSAAAR